MRESDIDAVLSLENISFPKSWQRSEFMAELTSPISINHVAKQLDSQHSVTVIAYSCAQLVMDELSLLKIAVLPAWCCKGVANQLLRQTIDIAIQKGAAKVFLEVRPSNQGAMALYLNSGFRIIGKRLNYYSETGEDALVMTKSLED
ncbi:MAG: ribosomal protein S18-alanine N-acetyltransferase [Pseudomonadota bacterium]